MSAQEKMACDFVYRTRTSMRPFSVYLNAFEMMFVATFSQASTSTKTFGPAAHSTLNWIPPRSIAERKRLAMLVVSSLKSTGRNDAKKRPASSRA